MDSFSSRRRELVFAEEEDGDASVVAEGEPTSVLAVPAADPTLLERLGVPELTIEGKIVVLALFAMGDLNWPGEAAIGDLARLGDGADSFDVSSVVRCKPELRLLPIGVMAEEIWPEPKALGEALGEAGGSIVVELARVIEEEGAIGEPGGSIDIDDIERVPPPAAAPPCGLGRPDAKWEALGEDASEDVVGRDRARTSATVAASFAIPSSALSTVWVVARSRCSRACTSMLKVHGGEVAGAL